jgi:hypothetical protein
LTFYESAYPSDYLQWALNKLDEGVFSENVLLTDQLVENYITSCLPKKLPDCHPFALEYPTLREGMLEFLYGKDGKRPITELDDFSRSKRVKAYLDSLFFQDGFCPECALEIPIFFGGAVLYEDILNWVDWSPGARLVFLLLIEIFYLGDLDEEDEDAFPGDLSLSETLARSLGPYIDWWGTSERYEPEDMLQNPLLSEIEFHTALVSGVENNPFIGYLARDGECVSDILSVSAGDYQEMSYLMALADIASQLANNGFETDSEAFAAGELFRTVSKYLICEDKNGKNGYYICGW